LKALRLGKIFGVELVIDASWLIIAGLITFSLYVDFSDRTSASGASAWVAAGVTSFLFFGSVLMHELSHSIVAKARGLVVRRIRLFIFGGVSEIENEAPTPGDEFAITIAGPASSVVLAGLFFLVALPLEGSVERVFALLAFVNLALGLFNLLPGFPLDGGRLLRSAVWKATGDFARGTRVAVFMGRLLAVLLSIAGLVVMVVGGQVAGLWYLAIGWFLYQAASSALVHMESSQSLRGATAGQVMSPTPIAVPAEMSVEELHDKYLLGGRSATFPVVARGRVRGLVALEHAAAIPSSDWSAMTVGQIMMPLGPNDVVEADALVEGLLERFQGRRRRIAVVSEGRIAGVLTEVDVTRFIRRAEAKTG